MTINWRQVDSYRWMGTCEAGMYHVLHVLGRPKEAYGVVFIALADQDAPPEELGYRSTEANAKYAAEMHNRLKSTAGAITT